MDTRESKGEEKRREGGEKEVDRRMFFFFKEEAGIEVWLSFRGSV